MFQRIENLIERFKKILPDSSDDQNTKFFKLMIYIVSGLLLFMILSCAVTFVIILQGAEEVMIPDITGIELEEALIMLQERGLNSKIQLKYSSDPGNRGRVLEQDPPFGTIKKAGNNVILKVSRGSVISKIEDYTGWNMAALEAHLKTLSNAYGPVLKISEPVIRVFSDEPEGTILEQKPTKGADLTAGVTELALVVSQGKKGNSFNVPNFIGLDYFSAMKKAAGTNIQFLFKQRKAVNNEGAGIIVDQTPSSGASVSAGTIVQFAMTPPALSGKKIFGIMEKTVQEFPVSVDIIFYRVFPSGTREEFLKIRSKGGAISIPYLEEEGTTIILYALDKELLQFTVKS